MKILKHGNRKPRKFTCPNCGCEFVADTTEYWVMECNGIVVFYKADCPECLGTSETSESWEEDNDLS